MATFALLGKYSADALTGISADRTKKAVEAIEKLGGQVHTMLAMLGPYDLLLIVDLPDHKQAMKASLALTRLTSISFTTCAAVPVDEFDQLASES